LNRCYFIWFYYSNC